MELRDYQVDCTAATYAWFAQNKEGNPLIVLPTAAGKSVCIAELIKSAIAASTTQRFLVVTHSKELIQQNHDKLIALWKNAPTGIYSASIGLKQSQRQIVFAGIQSIHKKPHIFGHRDLIIIDECHSIPNTEDGTYHKFLQEMKRINPRVRVVGYTATPYRMKGGHLLNGGVFTDIAYELPIRALLDRGFLCPVYTKAPEDMQVSMEGVRTVAGEYNQKQMQDKYLDGDVTLKAIKDALARATDRKCFLIFCAGVEHAVMTHNILRDLGLRGNVVCDKTPADERDSSIEKLRSGEYEYLTNNAILTTGTDIPRIDCIVILRSMKSRGLYVQIVGRCMRLHDDKKYSLLLDYGGNVERFGAIDQQPEGRKMIDAGGNQAAPFKRCNAENVDSKQWHEKPCGGISHATAKKCEICGAPFVDKEKHDTVAANGAVITPPSLELEEWEVTDVTFSAYFSKKSGNTTLRISYYNGWTKIVDEYKSLKQVFYFMKGFFGGEQKSFPTIEDAADYCNKEAIKPIMIQTIKDGKYDRVIGYGFPSSA